MLRCFCLITENTLRFPSWRRTATRRMLSCTSLLASPGTLQVIIDDILKAHYAFVVGLLEGTVLGTTTYARLFFFLLPFSFASHHYATACWGDKQWDRWRRMSLFHQSFYVHCEDSEQELDSITSATNVESSTKDSRNFLYNSSTIHQ